MAIRFTCRYCGDHMSGEEVADWRASLDTFKEDAVLCHRNPYTCRDRLEHRLDLVNRQIPTSRGVSDPQVAYFISGHIGDPSVMSDEKWLDTVRAALALKDEAERSRDALIRIRDKQASMLAIAIKAYPDLEEVFERWGQS